MTDTVYYTCSFVPPELIRACGFHPHRLTPTSKNIPQFQLEGMCSFTKAWVEELHDIADQNETAIAVFTTSCDQMRRAFDLVCHRKNLNTFLLDVPKTTNGKSLDYYQFELKRLMQFLCEISDRSLNENLLVDVVSKEAYRNDDGSGNIINIAITGGSVPDAVLSNIDKTVRAENMRISLNLSENMLFPYIAKENTSLSLDDLAEAYFHIPSIWKRPNDSFYEWFIQQISDTENDAVILFRHIFCDLWHSQVNEFKKRLQIPVIDIELDGQGTLSVAANSRLQAFLETLSC